MKLLTKYSMRGGKFYRKKIECFMIQKVYFNTHSIALFEALLYA
jgi:hypothetical protein